jgi:hypothetical protein
MPAVTACVRTTQRLHPASGSRRAGRSAAGARRARRAGRQDRDVIRLSCDGGWRADRSRRAHVTVENIFAALASGVWPAIWLASSYSLISASRRRDSWSLVCRAWEAKHRVCRPSFRGPRAGACSRLSEPSATQGMGMPYGRTREGGITGVESPSRWCGHR